jgi:hypothetical protein
MIDKISGSGAEQNSPAATKESLPRVSYTSQKFGPPKTSVTRDIDHMTKIGKQVKGIKVPVDFCSPTFLKGVKTQTDSSAEVIKANTQGVNVEHFLYLLSSVKSAQQSL